ncbi:MAG: type II toxin-antitoxin system RelE/ParE family toxin [Puniceicoccales bacterium]|jgi:mRNA interferase RelE/StbE|nr:type II toxin-antitoxin system RelE/ParE family toxin [Puniceicoccales bacterium]
MTLQFANSIVLQDWSNRYLQFEVMHQVTFSDQSLTEFNKMDKLAQLQFIDKLSGHCDECFHKNLSNTQKFRRENRDIYRCRIDDLRVYFEIQDEIVLCIYILHQHTLSDFVYRNKLPVSEEQIFEQRDSFWKYLLETFHRDSEP